MQGFRRRNFTPLPFAVAALALLSCSSSSALRDSELDDIRDYIQGLGLTDRDFYAGGGDYNVVVDGGFLGFGKKIGSIQPINGSNTLPDNLADWERITVLGRVKVDADYRGAQGGKWNYWAVVRRTVGGNTQYRSVYVADTGPHRKWAPGFGRVTPDHPHTNPRSEWVKNSDAEAWGSCGAWCCCDDNTCRTGRTEARN